MLRRLIHRNHRTTSPCQKERVTAGAATDIQDLGASGNPILKTNNKILWFLNHRSIWNSACGDSDLADDVMETRSVQRTQTFLRMMLSPGLGLRSCHQILNHVRDPTALISLKPTDLKPFRVPHSIATDFISSGAGERAEAEWERASELGVRMIDVRDPQYPPLLLETCDPPLILYVKGAGWNPARPNFAIVGARQASPYGVNFAKFFARELAMRGFVVVSGLARGIDTAAHEGALSVGATAAIFDTGIDLVYPRENCKLVELIVEKGALMSEFPLGTPPLTGHFPRRNRILACMTLGTIVVEAAERSGSLITARMALEANREVFAVPGPIQSKTSRGPHILIRQGACLACKPEEVIDEFPPEVRRQIDLFQDPENASPTGRSSHESIDGASLTPNGQRLREVLSATEGTPIDILIVKLQLPVPEVYAALPELKLAGLIRHLPGDRYLLNM